MEDELDLFEEAAEQGMEVVEYEEVSKKKKSGGRSVSSSANRASKALSKASSTLKEMRDKKKSPAFNHVLEILEHDPELHNYGEPPPWGDIVGNEMYAKVIEDMKSIVRGYIGGDFNYAKATEDQIRLAAYSQYLSSCLAVFQAQVGDAERRYDDMKTMGYVKAKRTSELEGARVSDSDAKKLAEYFAIPIAKELNNLKMVERYLLSAFHSLRRFQETLGYVGGREARMNTGPRYD